jgi:predicted transposase/invertase (TIGR01784 family)
MNIEKDKEDKRTLVSFDWAIKRLLRQKANFGILEGFLSELLFEEITIKNLLESESNKTDENDRSNQLDLLCENDKGELTIIEVQYHREIDYFQRMLYGTSKVITEYISAGDPYSNVRKVHSVNILYFDLGQGKDYLYKGTIEFVGLTNYDRLKLSRAQAIYYQKESPSELYPEYHLIKVNNFDNVAKDTLDEWVYYLKNSELPIKYKAKGLDKVEKQLKYDNMDATQKQEYKQYQKSLLVSDSALKTAWYEGREEGIEKGSLEEKIQVILNCHKKGFDIALISEIVSMTQDKVKDILKDQGLL